MAGVTGTRSTEFKLYAPQARRVILTGTFNSWNTRALSAKKDLKGNWTAKVGLKPGRYEYKFIVDNAWLSDPNCKSRVSNNLGTDNSVIEVR